MNKHHFLYPDSLIIIFAREPVKGRVKTRLIPALGQEGATKLYTQLLNYALNNVMNSALSPVELCVTPESHPDYFSRLSCAEQFSLSFQEGDDLGLRMLNALNQGLCHYSKVILMGTDCPFLTKRDLQEAITSLDKHDMVFSPASDGGYVLVGAKKVVPHVFENIEWGTDQVMIQSRQVLIESQISWQELSLQDDIDLQSDLIKLKQLDEFKDYYSY
ncbi:MAG: glycosyltransferase [Gammaproteobacteria bacterium]|nr:glycosyltransferase [Gammaproteobacteria bacterium]